MFTESNTVEQMIIDAAAKLGGKQALCQLPEVDNTCPRINTRSLPAVCIEEVQAPPPMMQLPELVV